MTDLLARLRDADNTRRIGESYADTHERRQRDREEAAALAHADAKGQENDTLLWGTIEQAKKLEAENASLASWQCEFTDGKTGLVYGEGGSTYCAMAKRVQKLEAARSDLLNSAEAHEGFDPHPIRHARAALADYCRSDAGADHP
jgi:hypothetical protein